MIYTSGDFDWLRNCRKQLTVIFIIIIDILYHQFFLCVCIKWIHLLYLLQTHEKKNGVEAIEYDSEIWINQGQLEKKLGLINISDRTQYHSSES